MRGIIFLLLLITTSISYGQGCGIISNKLDKKTGITYQGGIVTSKDYYSLLIRKVTDPGGSVDSLNYELLFNAASKFPFSDSVLNVPGQIEFISINGKSIKLPNVQHLNNPLGLGPSVGFLVRTTKSNIYKLTKDPAIKLVLSGLLETEFNQKNQKKLSKIADCLTN